MDNYFDLIFISIFLIAIMAAIILTYLLLSNIAPNYFNSIYILIGAIMVFSVDMYLNKKLTNENENRKKNRVKIVINNTIKNNMLTANINLDKLNKNHEERKIEVLQTGVWEILSYNIMEVDFNPDYFEKILSIRDLTYEINKVVKERKKFFEGINDSTSIPDAYPFSKKPNQFKIINKNLEKLLKVLIKESRDLN